MTFEPRHDPVYEKKQTAIRIIKGYSELHDKYVEVKKLLRIIVSDHVGEPVPHDGLDRVLKRAWEIIDEDREPSNA